MATKDEVVKLLEEIQAETKHLAEGLQDRANQQEKENLIILQEHISAFAELLKKEA